VNGETREALERVVADVIEPAARTVDQEGKFPREGIDALARAGMLGLTMDAECGGGGAGLRTATEVVERVARACGSTAMVLLMHYTAAAVLNRYGPAPVRQRIAGGEHLSTIAFSEPGSRSHFWISAGRAERDGDTVVLNGRKAWITAATEADSYVWSTLPAGGEGAMSLWLVPSRLPGLSEPPPFDGLGLRGNGSSPVTATGVRIPQGNLLGDDGAGLEVAMGTILPYFLTLSASFSLGLVEEVFDATVKHLTATRLDHLDITLAEQPVTRSVLGRMRVDTDRTRTLVESAATAVELDIAGKVMRPMEAKAAAAETAIAVTDQAMTICGGAAFRKDMGLERRFRDARAARVMAPTTEALHDFIARILCGLPMFGG